MLSFLVDCHVVAKGMLSSYVVATDTEHAKRIAQNAVSKQYGQVTQAISYAMDEIPADCPYFGPSGQLMPSWADQIRGIKLLGGRVFRSTNRSCCSCGSHFLHLLHEFSAEGLCAYCAANRLSPGAENLVEVK